MRNSKIIIRSTGEKDSVILMEKDQIIFEEVVPAPFSVNIGNVLKNAKNLLEDHKLKVNNLIVQYKESSQTARRTAFSCAEAFKTFRPEIEVFYQLVETD